VLPFASPSQLQQGLESVNKWIINLDKLKNVEIPLKLTRYTNNNSDILSAIQNDDKDELMDLLKGGTRVCKPMHLQIIFLFFKKK
jgi:hypothetical protein